MNQQFLCSKMMLPEHCSELRKHTENSKWAEDYRRPLLDEQFREELQQRLEQAFAARKALRVAILQDRAHHTITGVPLRFEPTTGVIYFDTGGPQPMPILAAEIVNLEFP